MQLILQVIHFIVAFLLIVAVLMQRSEGGGLGLGTAASSGLVNVRGAANFMTKFTGILAALFIGISLVLAIMASRTTHQSKSLIQELSAPEAPVSAPAEQVIPTVPLQDQ